MTDSTPSFEIERRPERVYRRGGVAHEGGTAFLLTPDREPSKAELVDLVEDVLDRNCYTHGDWFDLPEPVYLVHDGDTDDVFRVVIRYGCVELHVLPDTDAEGLRAIYRRLCDCSPFDWRVDRETTAAE